MANLIDAPAKFLEKPGPPPIAWHEWKCQWDTYIIAIDGEQFSDKRCYIRLEQRVNGAIQN